MEIEEGRVEPVFVEIESIPLEEEVHLPGLERGVRRETQVLRDGELLLPAVAVIEAEEDERHSDDKGDRKSVEDDCRRIEEGWPAVGVGRLLAHVRDIFREPLDPVHEREIEDHLDVQRIVLWSGTRYDDGLRRPLDRKGGRMRVDILDLPCKRQRNPEAAEGDMLIHELQVQVRPLPVVLDRRPGDVAVFHRIGARGKVVRVEEAGFAVERKAPDRPDV